MAGHVEEKGHALREQYGPSIGWSQLLRILRYRTRVRYPCELCFDASALRSGEFAHPVPNGSRPEDGYVIHVHPHFAEQLDRVTPLVLYHQVVINYGGFASGADAELFGAAALGLDRKDYYRLLCTAADEVTAPTAACGTRRT